jgi:hypothetical protein
MVIILFINILHAISYYAKTMPNIQELEPWFPFGRNLVPARFFFGVIWHKR